jgi:hypothetical protein
MFFSCTYKSNKTKFEHMNEGRLYQVDRTHGLEKNLDSGLYPMCTRDIRSNASTDRYCNDIPPFVKYTQKLYGSDKWIQTKHPSYFFPPYSTKVEPNHSYSPDWWHRYE